MWNHVSRRDCGHFLDGRQHSVLSCDRLHGRCLGKRGSRHIDIKHSCSRKFINTRSYTYISNLTSTNKFCCNFRFNLFCNTTPHLKLSHYSLAYPYNTNIRNPFKKKLSTGAKIAIGVVAAAIAIIAVVLIILYYYFRHPKQAGTSHRHPFPNITGDGEGIEYVPPQEQFKGSENNPIESYRSYQPQGKDIQYIPVAALPYQTTEQTPFQSTTNTATVPTSPP